MLRLAVLSDIHAHSSARLEAHETPPSYVEISAPESPTNNPFAALEKLIADEGLRADVLISGGDMGDRATPEAVKYAWNRIQRLATPLESQILLAATGNHDMDSRAINGYDAKAILQGLDAYPFADAALNNEYWANNLVVQEHGSFRSVLLNSSAYHGYAKEWAHGRVSKRTREYLRTRLQETYDPGINILLTHHQVYKFGSIDLDDKSEMEEASALLEDLGSGEFGSWLIIHGHRHWPAITHAGGSRSAPLVFSAGSFSAVLWPELQARARNQFYILDLEPVAPGDPIRGRFRAWDLILDEGFLPAQERSGLTYSGGFGGTLNGTQLARQVADLFSKSGAGRLDWADVETAIPDARFTMPTDFKSFIKKLSEVHSLELLCLTDGTPAQVGRA